MLVNSEGYSERVTPDNGRKETTGVFLAIVVILLLGGFWGSQNQVDVTPPPKHLSLSVIEKAVLVALINAGDEILFMAENGDSLPQIDELIASDLPPFSSQIQDVASYRWQQLKGCYLGIPERAESSAQFMLTFDGGINVYWSSLVTAVEHTLETKNCHPDASWQVFNNA
ncbi:hypothetical protein [Neptunomonas japonica]|uniref:hypothetical protein n=1 Tax=Neptunomonas japonica TaxID=417574 RepID=UPI000428400C|nr:hypothetical protein [Neptunomonas japonica]